MTRVLGLAFVALAVVCSSGCKRSQHARVSGFARPPVPAGFTDQAGPGWRLSVPATWQLAPQRPPATWASADPRAADDYHANATIVTEPYAGDSYEYARANETGLRAQKQASVDVTHDDVIDGDPTLLIESRWAPSPPSTAATRTLQTALSSKGTGYVVTCAVAASAFERYRSTCESILRSFAVER